MKVLLLVIVSALCIILVSAKVAGFTTTPIGPVPSECVHEVPSDTEVIEQADGFDLAHHSFGTRRIAKPHLAHCREVMEKVALGYLRKRQFPADYDGWLAYTTFAYPAGLSSFYGNFSVPTTSPKYSPDELFIFTGLQNVDWIPKVDKLPKIFDIIQPVLQYPANSGSGWSVRSWYVTLDVGVIVSDEIAVKPGEVIYSFMLKTGLQSWVISAKNSKGQWTTVKPNAARLQVQPWAYNTIECYGCQGCEYEPTTPTHFTQLLLQDTTGKTVTPSWVTHVSPNPRCKEGSNVINPSTVDLYFNGN